MPAFNDSAWRLVDLPHDWSAEGPFTADYGSGNGYAPGGIGWYRKHFTLAADLAGRIATIEFDGVYDHAEVWVNGHFVGGRPYGYSSFECPLTPLRQVGSADNVIAVRVDHSRFADSRWYTGLGHLPPRPAARHRSAAHRALGHVRHDAGGHRGRGDREDRDRDGERLRTRPRAHCSNPRCWRAAVVARVTTPAR